MFLRMLARAAMLRKARALSALVAIIVASSAATAMLNLITDIDAKLRKEFRKFGANLIVEAKAGQFLTPEYFQKIQSVIAGRGLAVPFAYTVARTDRDQSIVVAATDFSLVRKLNPWWAVSSWPTKAGEALIGVRAFKLLRPGTGSFGLTHDGRAIRFSSAGTVQTGAGEDSRVYISLHDFQSWTGSGSSVVELAVNGSASDVDSLLRTLRQQLPALDVRPVRQVTEAEANVLGKTQSTLLASTFFIVVTAALCVLSTLMGWVFDRRRDFAIMKALGASDRLIELFVAAEAAVMGMVGGILGFACGVGIAAWIGRVNFDAPVSPTIRIFPGILTGCILLTLLASLLPLRLLRHTQPAMILRGE